MVFCGEKQDALEGVDTLYTFPPVNSVNRIRVNLTIMEDYPDYLYAIRGKRDEKVFIIIIICSIGIHAISM